MHTDTPFYQSKTLTGAQQSLKRRSTYSFVLRDLINHDVAGILQVAATADVLWGVPRPVQGAHLDKRVVQVGWRRKNFCS